jgi:mRNA interferase RelE/StbE
MAWKIELSPAADRGLTGLDHTVARRILKFLYERVANLENPRSLGQALQGSVFGSLWRYRVGDYRIVCEIRDKELIVVVVRIGHRREIYRQ